MSLSVALCVGPEPSLVLVALPRLLAICGAAQLLYPTTGWRIYVRVSACIVAIRLVLHILRARNGTSEQLSLVLAELAQTGVDLQQLLVRASLEP